MKEKSFLYLFKVLIIDEYQTEPDYAIVKFTPSLIKRIFTLNKIVKNIKAAHIADYDSTPNWYNIQEDLDNDNDGQLIKQIPEELSEWSDGSIDSCYLLVQDNRFYWKGYIKNTDISVETSSMYLKDLKSLYEVMLTQKKRLPLLINSEKDIKLYASIRLAEKD